MTLKAGESIQQYVVTAVLHAERNTRLYRVRHRVLGHELVMRVLDPYWASQESVRNRFFAQGVLQAQVRHANVVNLHDTLYDPKRDLAALIEDWVEGPTLSEVVERLPSPPPPEVVRAIFRPLVRALCHAHAEGVVHSDLHTRNIRLTRDAHGKWYPRIAGWGNAHRIGEEQEAGSGLLGHAGYMSPEQSAGRKQPTPLWDVFSLGVILCELATLVHPFQRSSEEETLAAVLDGDRLPAHRIYPHLDVHLDATIDQSLEPDPAQRLQSMVEFGASLSGEVVLPDPGTHSIGGEEFGEITVPRDLLPEAMLAVVDEEHEHAEAWGVQGFNTTVGSGEGSNVKLPDLGVERVHCLLRFTSGYWHVEDLSKSGIHVNGARVRSIQLHSGDVLRLGRLVLRFEAKVALEEFPEDAPTAEAARRAWLEYRTGDAGHPMRIPVTQEGVVIGRDPDVDLLVSDPEVSRRHCIVRLKGLRATVEDLDSANGTFVDGHRIELTELSHGQVVSVGSTRLSFFQAR